MSLRHPNPDADSSDDDEQYMQFLFEANLEVGSHYLDIDPESELTFYHTKGDLYGRFTLSNVTNNSAVAFFVNTSAKETIHIIPKCGFI
jgi:hypothetical protein